MHVFLCIFPEIFIYLPHTSFPLTQHRDKFLYAISLTDLYFAGHRLFMEEFYKFIIFSFTKDKFKKLADKAKLMHIYVTYIHISMCLTASLYTINLKT